MRDVRRAAHDLAAERPAVLELRMQGTWLAGSPTIAPVMRRACRILRVRRPDEGSAVYGRQERERSEMWVAASQRGRADRYRKHRWNGSRVARARRQLPPEPTTTLSLPPRSLTMRDGPSARVRCGLLPASHLSPQALQRIASWYQHQRRRQRAPAPLLVGISRRRESQRAACSASAAPAPCLACQAVAAGEVRSRWPLARRGHRRTRRADQPPARPSSAANLEATFAASLRRRRPLRARSRIAA